MDIPTHILIIILRMNFFIHIPFLCTCPTKTKANLMIIYGPKKKYIETGAEKWFETNCANCVWYFTSSAEPYCMFKTYLHLHAPWQNAQMLASAWLISIKGHRYLLSNLALNVTLTVPNWVDLIP